MSVARSLVVFFSLGALVYLAVWLADALGGDDPIRVVVPAEASEAEITAAKREAVLVREAKRLGVLTSDPALVQWIAEALPEDQRTREDILAMLEMGLEESDPVIRKRLVYWAERLIEGAADTDITDEQLTAHLAEHPGRFTRPARTRLELVYFSRARRGAAAERDALAAPLSEDPERVGEAYRLGDPQMHLRPLVVATDEDLTSRYGPEVARAAASLEPRRWSGPIATRTGFYRARVIERSAPREPALTEARDAVRSDLMRMRRSEALKSGVARLIREADFEVERR